MAQAGASAAKREVRVLARGRLWSHATRRSMLMAAIATCCKWVFSKSPDTGSVAGQRPAPLARVSLRPLRDIDSAAAPPHWHTRPGPPGALQSAPATADVGGARSP